MLETFYNEIGWGGGKSEKKEETYTEDTESAEVTEERMSRVGRLETPFRRMAFPPKRIGRHGAGVEILRRAEGARLRMTGWWSG